MKELLSPAGNMESLKAAIHGGADAIYIGMKNFGARKFANNFDDDELIEAVKMCHLYGVKLYVTMNTVIKDNEVEDFLKQVSFLYNSGVDAFIMQDFGMINLILNTYPDIEIHASTQFNNSGIETIKLLKKMGVKRVVLSRELSLDEINKIDVDIENDVIFLVYLVHVVVIAVNVLGVVDYHINFIKIINFLMMVIYLVLRS